MRVVLILVMLVFFGSDARAQSSVSDAQQTEVGLIPVQSFSRTRDCQTVRTCNFARNGRVRGCLSSYSCRKCRFVRVCRPRNRTTGTNRRCEYISRCDWGGGV